MCRRLLLVFDCVSRNFALCDHSQWCIFDHYGFGVIILGIAFVPRLLLARCHKTICHNFNRIQGDSDEKYDAPRINCLLKYKTH